MQNSHATCYTFVVTVVILWALYKVEYHPQCMQQLTCLSTSDSTCRFGELTHTQVQGSTSKKGKYFGFHGKKIKIKTHNKEAFKLGFRSSSLFTSVYKQHACDSTERGWHLTAITHNLLGFQEVVEGLCQDLSVFLLNPEVIKLPNSEEATPNNQTVTLQIQLISLPATLKLHNNQLQKKRPQRTYSTDTSFLHIEVSFYLLQTKCTHILDCLIGKRKHVLSISWIHMFSKSSALMAGLPSAIYLRYPVGSHSWKRHQATLSPNWLRHEAQLSKGNVPHVTEGT